LEFDETQPSLHVLYALWLPVKRCVLYSNEVFTVDDCDGLGGEELLLQGAAGRDDALRTVNVNIVDLLASLMCTVMIQTVADRQSS